MRRSVSYSTDQKNFSSSQHLWMMMHILITETYPLKWVVINKYSCTMLGKVVLQDTVKIMLVFFQYFYDPKADPGYFCILWHYNLLKISYKLILTRVLFCRWMGSILKEKTLQTMVACVRPSEPTRGTERGMVMSRNYTFLVLHSTHQSNSSTWVLHM